MIEKLLEDLHAIQFLVDRKFDAGRASRRDALHRQIIERERTLVKALERIVEKCDSWEGRDNPPWWNLGDIARATLLSLTKGEPDGQD